MDVLPYAYKGLTLGQAEKCDSRANLEVGFWVDLSCNNAVIKKLWSILNLKKSRGQRKYERDQEPFLLVRGRRTGC